MPGHPNEPYSASLAARLNWQRAGVPGAADGVISAAGLVIGVAAATTDTNEIATAGVAGLVARAVSMALGDYVSVSTQRDTERALLDKERRELEEWPEDEHAELVDLLRQRGLSAQAAETVAPELGRSDVLRAHLDIELGIDQEDLANPWVAAGSSALVFVVGALLPLIAILLPTRVVQDPDRLRCRARGTACRRATQRTARRIAQTRLRVTSRRRRRHRVTFGIGQLLGTAVV